MRIISGLYKGYQLKVPAGLPVRPTTDRAKESLFNILEINFDLESCTVLDLFAGTGNISFECCSRGAVSVTAVDKHPRCTAFIGSVKEKLGLTNLSVVRADVFSWLKKATGPFELIFADPPYALPAQAQLPDIIMDKGLLSPGGWLIIEHAIQVKIPHPALFDERNYGQSVFSFYKKS